MRFNEQNLEQAMRTHNWFFREANDPVFTTGKFERDFIHNMMKEVGESKSRELWGTWAPGIEKSAFPEHLFK